MSKLYLNASKRDAVGSNKSNILRKSGLVPGILFGSHMDPVAISLTKLEVDKFVAQNNVGSKVFVNFEGKEVMAFVKDIQKDVFGASVLHVDLQALTKEDKVRMSVRLNFTGKENLPLDAISQELVNEIELEMLPEFMIDSLSIDVSALKFGEVIKVSDLEINNDKNFRVMSAMDMSLFNLVHPSGKKEEEPVEAVEAVAVAAE